MVGLIMVIQTSAMATGVAIIGSSTRVRASPRPGKLRMSRCAMPRPKVTVGAVALTVTLGLGIAHLLIRNFPGRGLARTLVLLPMIATPVAMALVWMTMMSPTIGVLNYVLRSVGLAGSAWVSSPRSVIPSLLLVETWMWTPMTALICLAGLGTLPSEPL